VVTLVANQPLTASPGQAIFLKIVNLIQMGIARVSHTAVLYARTHFVISRFFPAVVLRVSFSLVFRSGFVASRGGNNILKMHHPSFLPSSLQLIKFQKREHPLFLLDIYNRNKMCGDARSVSTANHSPLGS
jgi:hypothetical protein